MESDSFKVFVSLPMRGLSTEKIATRQQEIFSKFAREGWELLDTISPAPDADSENDLWYLGRSVQLMGKADVVIFAKDWRNARGCIVEHLITEAYGINCLYEDNGVK